MQVSALFAALAGRCPTGYEEAALVAMTRPFCSRRWGSGWHGFGRNLFWL